MGSTGRAGSRRASGLALAIGVTALLLACGGGVAPGGPPNAVPTGAEAAARKSALAAQPLSDLDALRYTASYDDLIAAFGTDVAQARAHHAGRAAVEGRTISFDPMRYLASYEDLIAAFGTDALAATRHYIQDGWRENRSRGRFDALRYLASYTDLIAAYGADTAAATLHYLRWGWREGRSARFDAAQYLANYADLRAAFGSDLTAATLHFINNGASEGRTDAVPAPPPAFGIVNPVLFVTQVPTQADFAARASTFGNHQGDIASVARGGDLMIRYPDGRLRNLTREAGFGMDGQQGANAIAVREPTVHWSGSKALFSMVVGAPTARYQVATFTWQLYEVSGLGPNETAVITKVPGQPAGYNNVSPLYASDDRVVFTSDRPRNGAAHLYPQLDEYESTATVTGLWSIDPRVAGGDLKLLNHAVSGAFSPTVDSFGRIVFTRWDHLQRDQQADADRASPASPPYASFNYAGEAADAAPTGSRDEVFPESRLGQSSPFGPVNGHTYNLFTPWQINQDGTEEETLNHIGIHELSFGYRQRSFAADAALSDYTVDSLHANRKSIRGDGGLFHLREEPSRPGSYLATYAREFGSLSANQLVRLSGAPTLNAEQMEVVDLTAPDTGAGLPGGRYRNPLPMANDVLLASHSPTAVADPARITEFRLKVLVPDGNGGLYRAGEAITGAGIRKAVSWWDPDTLRSHDGLLWELEAVEVVRRAAPPARTPSLEPPEAQVLAEAQVDLAALRAWMKARDLALIVTRDQTSRDRADLSQPFNLQVPGGTRTVSPRGGRSYDIAHFQVVQADQVRGYRFRGRRAIAQPMHDAGTANPANPGGPAGSVRIAADGSTAAFVPARRALAWQTTDPSGEPVVRERVWVSFQPGEVRVCASCHGVNSRDQAGRTTPTNPPQALRELLTYWKTLSR
jgi:hypothetical protein